MDKEIRIVEAEKRNGSIDELMQAMIRDFYRRKRVIVNQSSLAPKIRRDLNKYIIDNLLFGNP
jgi:hypothetical protein